MRLLSLALLLGAAAGRTTEKDSLDLTTKETVFLSHETTEPTYSSNSSISTRSTNVSSSTMTPPTSTSTLPTPINITSVEEDAIEQQPALMQLKDLRNMTLEMLAEYRLELELLLYSLDEQILAANVSESDSGLFSDFNRTALVNSTLSPNSSTLDAPKGSSSRGPFILEEEDQDVRPKSYTPEETMMSVELTTTEGGEDGTTTGASPSQEPSTEVPSAPFRDLVSPFPGNGTAEEAVTTSTTPVTTTTSVRGTSPGPSSSPSPPPRQSVRKVIQVRRIRQRARVPKPRPPVNRCSKRSQDQLVAQLKSEGTYNPDYMAWDVPGVIRFLESAALTSYDSIVESIPSSERLDSAAVEANLGALERILRELDVDCSVRGPDTIAKLYNVTYAQGGWRGTEKDRLRTKRESSHQYERLKYLSSLYRDEVIPEESSTTTERPKDAVIGQVHTVPFGCSRRGSEEEGYLRLCGVCQAIRRLPDDFFPPFINEVLCDEDKACLYFYDFPHGKCKQKQMNFVVLRNVGTPDCEAWQRFSLTVRVSCECFVDRMSFFAKYV